jgi:hypothetical protein
MLNTDQYKNQKLEELRDVSSEIDPIATFYQRINKLTDPSTGLDYALPGSRENKTLIFKDKTLLAFHVLRKDNFCSEHLAIFKGRVVVLKIFDHPNQWEGHVHGFESRFYTEIDSINFLKNEKKMRVVDIIDHSLKDKILIKEFIPGLPLSRTRRDTRKIVLNESNIVGLALDYFISSSDYKKIDDLYRSVHDRVDLINRSDYTFKKWAHQRHLIAYIDLTMPQTTLYWNGNWYINSPYSLY